MNKFGYKQSLQYVTTFIEILDVDTIFPNL